MIPAKNISKGELYFSFLTFLAFFSLGRNRHLFFQEVHPSRSITPLIPLLCVLRHSLVLFSRPRHLQLSCHFLGISLKHQSSSIMLRLRLFRVVLLPTFLWSLSLSLFFISSQDIAVFASGSTSNLGLHYSRQADMPIGDIPPQCQSSCQSFTDITNLCVGPSTIDVTCLCSDTAANAVLTCINCIASMTTPDFRPDEQQKLDDLAQACQEAGHPFNETLQLAPASASNNNTSGSLSLRHHHQTLPLSLVLALLSLIVFARFIHA